MKKLLFLSVMFSVFVSSGVKFSGAERGACIVRSGYGSRSGNDR